MKVWLVLFGILLELDHTLVRVLLQKSSCVRHRQPCRTQRGCGLFNERTALTADDDSDTHLSASDVIMNGNGKRKKKEKDGWIQTFAWAQTRYGQCRSSPSSPSYCSLCHTYAAASPSSWREDAASARSSETLVVCQPSCSCLVGNANNMSAWGSHPLLVYETRWWWGGARQQVPSLLTPATHSMLPTCHHIFTLLVFPRDHLELNAGVSHSVVSAGKMKQQGILTPTLWTWLKHELRGRKHKETSKNVGASRDPLTF